MSDYGTHAAGLATAQARLGADCPTINWGNVDYQIIPGSAIRRQDLAPGGFQLNADLRFDALTATFGLDATTLKSKLLRTPITYLSDTYQVSGVNILPGALQITVECTAIYQKA